MHSWNSMTRWGSTFRPWAVHPRELTAVGALLACLAVVLNVSPFAKASKREAVRAATEQLIGPASIAQSQIGAGTQLDRSQSNVEATGVSEPIQPVGPKGQDVEMQGEQARHDRGTPDAVTQPLATIVGVWVADAGACSARNFREGFLPTIINTDGAWAGETFCIFKNQRQTETGWRVVASCSNPRKHWTTDVRLSVKDNRLIWTSKRGTQAYTRCAPEFLMAAVR